MTEAAEANNYNSCSTAAQASEAVVEPNHQQPILDKRHLKISLSTAKKVFDFEKTVYEKLVNGVEFLTLTAPGPASSQAVELSNILSTKGYAERTSIATTYDCGSTTSSSGNIYSGGRNGRPNQTVGISIEMKRANGFRLSKIPPSVVEFREFGKTLLPFDVAAVQNTVSVNYGPNFRVTKDENQKETLLHGTFSDELTSAGQDVDRYEPFHRTLLEKAFREFPNAKSNDDVRIVEAVNLDKLHPDLHTALCRICHDLSSSRTGAATAKTGVGSVFISIFKEGKRPFGNLKNFGMLYVVSPERDDFESKDEFLLAVRKTAHNIMSSLLEYSFLVKCTSRYYRDLERFSSVKMSLFSTDQSGDASKVEVASSILLGLMDGYRYAMSPRLIFDNDASSAFREAWETITVPQTTI